MKSSLKRYRRIYKIKIPAISRDFFIGPYCSISKKNYLNCYIDVAIRFFLIWIATIWILRNCDREGLRRTFATKKIDCVASPHISASLGYEWIPAYAGMTRNEVTFYSFLNETCIVVPFPSSECATLIFPLWYSSTIRFVKDKPKPQPRFLVVKPGSKTRLN